VSCIIRRQNGWGIHDYATTVEDTRRCPNRASLRSACADLLASRDLGFRVFVQRFGDVALAVLPLADSPSRFRKVDVVVHGGATRVTRDAVAEVECDLCAARPDSMVPDAWPSAGIASLAMPVPCSITLCRHEHREARWARALASLAPPGRRGGRRKMVGELKACSGPRASRSVFDYLDVLVVGFARLGALLGVYRPSARPSKPHRGRRGPGRAAALAIMASVFPAASTLVGRRVAEPRGAGSMVAMGVGNRTAETFAIRYTGSSPGRSGLRERETMARPH